MGQLEKIMLLCLISGNLLASDYVKLETDVPQQGCSYIQEELSKVFEANNIKMSNLSSKLEHSYDPETFRRDYSFCMTEIVITDPHYTLQYFTKNTKKSRSKESRDAYLKDYLNLIESRKNLLWHFIDETYFLKYRGHKVHSLYLVPKI